VSFRFELADGGPIATNVALCVRAAYEVILAHVSSPKPLKTIGLIFHLLNVGRWSTLLKNAQVGTPAYPKPAEDS
jgi:hypothetical protein